MANLIAIVIRGRGDDIKNVHMFANWEMKKNGLHTTKILIK